MCIKCNYLYLSDRFLVDSSASVTYFNEVDVTLSSCPCDVAAGLEFDIFVHPMVVCY